MKEIEETFDLVTCLRALHYVEEVERALVRLFESVNKSGFLIFNYPNYPCYLKTKKSVYGYKYEREGDKPIWLNLYKPSFSKKNLLTQKKEYVAY